mgnify:CR=1 FL=1
MLAVPSMRDMGHNLADLRAKLGCAVRDGHQVKFEAEGVTVGQNEISLLDAVMAFVWESNRDLHREGIEAAKAQSKYKGRKPTLTTRQGHDIVRRRDRGESVADIAEHYGVSIHTIYRSLKKMEAL